MGGAQIFFKREDLNHTGSHKINNALGQGLLAKQMGKTTAEVMKLSERGLTRVMEEIELPLVPVLRSMEGAEGEGSQPMLGRRVVVYGGGNTAIDVARTAKRLGATDAVVVYRRTRDRMPAHDSEVEEALAEGVRKFEAQARAQGRLPAPEGGIGHLVIREDAGAVGRIGLEPGELPVAGPFEEDPDQIKRQPGPCDRRNRCGIATGKDSDLRRAGDQHQQHSLAKPDLGQRGEGEPPGLSVFLQDPDIALVLALTPPAAQQMDPEPKAPGRGHRHDQRGERTRRGLHLHPADQSHQPHPRSPEGIDERDVTQSH